MLTQHHTKQGIQFVQLELLNSMMNEPRNLLAFPLFGCVCTEEAHAPQQT